MTGHCARWGARTRIVHSTDRGRASPRSSRGARCERRLGCQGDRMFSSTCRPRAAPRSWPSARASVVDLAQSFRNLQAALDRRPRPNYWNQRKPRGPWQSCSEHDEVSGLRAMPRVMRRRSSRLAWAGTVTYRVEASDLRVEASATALDFAATGGGPLPPPRTVDLAFNGTEVAVAMAPSWITVSALSSSPSTSPGDVRDRGQHHGHLGSW